jgi:glutamate/tyrosine decarboxylase-like PLP-dependent enzyme
MTVDYPFAPAPGATLDPEDWDAMRAQGHRMLDDILDHLQTIRSRPVWQPMPGDVRAAFKAPLPTAPTDIAEVHDDFRRNVLPYGAGNVHPRFMGWVHGGGNVAGLLADMLAGGMNANLGGRDHSPIAVEHQIVEWMRAIYSFPETASGLFVTGTSMANLIAVLVARTKALGASVRKSGLGNARLAAYSSVGAHACISRAMDFSGLGSNALRQIPVDANHRIRIPALIETIEKDIADGVTPFMIVGNAGTVDTGAIDDLAALSALAKKYGIWFHVDGAFGALAMLSPELAPRLTGIEQADSIAFDFHKWVQVPYDAGFILVRDRALHLQAFASPAAYLRRETRGLAAGDLWPCDLGPDLSRGFRALKTWFTLRTYGTKALGEVIARTCNLAAYMTRLIEAEPRLELMAPTQLNIVCFRYRCANSDSVNARIVTDLHEAGIAVPSTTIIGGHLVIRAAIVNHRTEPEDVAALIAAVIEMGERSQPA